MQVPPNVARGTRVKVTLLLGRCSRQLRTRCIYEQDMCSFSNITRRTVGRRDPPQRWRNKRHHNTGGLLEGSLLDMGFGHRDLQTLPATLLFMGLSQINLMRITYDTWGRTQTQYWTVTNNGPETLHKAAKRHNKGWWAFSASAVKRVCNSA
jgi:hypothetical protein